MQVWELSCWSCHLHLHSQYKRDIDEPTSVVSKESRGFPGEVVLLRLHGGNVPNSLANCKNT